MNLDVPVYEIDFSGKTAPTIKKKKNPRKMLLIALIISTTMRNQYVSQIPNLKQKKIVWPEVPLYWNNSGSILAVIDP